MPASYYLIAPLSETVSLPLDGNLRVIVDVNDMEKIKDVLIIKDDKIVVSYSSTGGAKIVLPVARKTQLPVVVVNDGPGTIYVINNTEDAEFRVEIASGDSKEFMNDGGSTWR